MAKILISSLGAGVKRDGEYQKAIYEIDKKISYFLYCSCIRSAYLF